MTQHHEKKVRLRSSKPLLVATYNVCSLSTAKLHQLLTGCNKFDIDVVILQEHRQHFDHELDFLCVNEGLIVRASANARGVGGIGVFVSNRVKNAATFSLVSNRIIQVTLDCNPQISIIGAYAPTELAETSDKNDFYQQLERTIDQVAPHDLLIVAGDLNARIGFDQRNNSDRHLGPHLYHQETNDNGSRLIQFCRSHNLADALSIFPHRSGRKWTWTHPRGTNAQLDHILINNKWVNSLRNCRAYSSINVESDHRIVCAKIKVSLRSCPKNKPSLNIDWSKLYLPPIQQRFNIEINNRFDLLAEPASESNLQSNFDSLVNTVNQVALSVLGKKQKTKLPSWVSEPTIGLVQQRDEARAKYRANKRVLAQYRDGLTVEQIEELAKDRNSWKKIVAVCCPKAAFD